jgi:hypothetical protein
MVKKILSKNSLFSSRNIYKTRLSGSKKGFELSINMIVVIILGVVLLMAGISIFYKGYNKVVEMRKDVDSQNKQSLNNLMMNSDAIVALPFSSKEGKRGGFVDFDLGINNELGSTTTFYTCVDYSGTSADYSSGDEPFTNEDKSWLIVYKGLLAQTVRNNDHAYIPLRISIPKKGVLKGQYVFNVIVKYDDGKTNVNSNLSPEQICEISSLPQYGTTQKIYVKI